MPQRQRMLKWFAGAGTAAMVAQQTLTMSGSVRAGCTGSVLVGLAR